MVNTIYIGMIIVISVNTAAICWALRDLALSLNDIKDVLERRLNKNDFD